jgi:hypothetical protein
MKDILNSVGYQKLGAFVVETAIGIALALGVLIAFVASTLGISHIME